MLNFLKKLFKGSIELFKELYLKHKLVLLVVAVIAGLIFYAVGIATNFFASPIFSPFFIISYETAHSVAVYAALFVAINLVLISIAVYYLRQNNDSIEGMLTDTGAKIVAPITNIANAGPVTVNIQPESEIPAIQPVAEITPVSTFTTVTLAKPIIASIQAKTSTKTLIPVAKPITKRRRKSHVLKRKTINKQRTQELKLKRRTNKELKKTLRLAPQRQTSKGLKKPNRQTIVKHHAMQKLKKPSRQIGRKPKANRRRKNSLRRTGFTPRANIRLKKSSRRAKNNLKIRKPAKLVSNIKKIVNMELEQPAFTTSNDPTNVQLEELWNRMDET